MTEAARGWLQIAVTVDAERVECAETALGEAGALAITLLDDADQPILEPAPGATPLWARLKVQGLFAADADAGEIRRHLGRALGQCIEVHSERLAERCWETVWLERFRPMRFGRRLWVCPGGQSPPTSHALVLELDPGLAFGSGTHPTTALCLEWLDAQDLTGCQLLDYGCGSGILALAGLRLGALGATATDIDEQAIQATQANAARNRLADRLRACRPDELGSDQFDLVVANILAGPLVALAPALGPRLAPGGRMALAGLIEEQVGAVAAAYRPWLALRVDARREGWCRLAGRRLP